MDNHKLLKKDIKLKINYIFLLCVGAVIIFIIQIKNLGNIYGPTIMDDELGYWGAAAYFCGVDWSYAMAGFNYYAYGYGLLLAPVFKLVKSPVMMYKTAVVINIFFVVACFFIAYHILVSLAENTGKNLLVIIAFVSVCTTNNLYQSQITWAESFILLLTWVIADIVVHMLKKPSEKTIISCAAISAFIFFVHQRTIGITVVVVLFVICMSACKKISVRQLLYFMVAFFSIFVCGLILKHKIQHNLYDVQVSTKYDLNDVAGVSDGIIGYFKSCIKGEKSITELFAGLSGKIFYFGMASYMLIYFAAYYIAHALKNLVRTKKISRKHTALIIFTLFLAAEIMITVLFMLRYGRNDCIYYGRYAEMTLGPLAALTLLLFNEEGISIKRFAIISIVGITLQYLFLVWSQHELWQGDFTFWDTMSPSLVNLNKKSGILIEKSIIISIISLLGYIMFAGKKRCMGNLCAVIMFIITIWNFNEITIRYNNNQNDTKNFIDLFENVEKQYKKENIYYYMEHDTNAWIYGETLQYIIKDEKVNYISIDDIKNKTYKNPVIIVYWGSDQSVFSENGYELINSDATIFSIYR